MLGAARASIAALLRTLRPFVALAAGEEAARGFVPGAALATDDDVVRALEPHAALLAAPPLDLIRRCREAGEVEPVALGLGVNLAALNAVLARLGPPYASVDLTARHQDTLARFLDRKEAFIRESIRATFRPNFNRAEDLADYVARRDTPRPTLPDGFGLRAIELPQVQLSEWLAAWMEGMGISPIAVMPTGRASLEAVREANMRRLREFVRPMRVAILSRADPGDALRGVFGELPAAEAALNTVATRGGWCDFDRLDEQAALGWSARCGIWPPSWPTTLVDLGVTDEEQARVAAADEAQRVAAVTKRRVISYTGGAFTVGVDSLANLSDHIAALVAGNSALLATSNRVVHGTAPVLTPSRPGAGGGGGGGGGGPRLSDEERGVIGFFGEAIAFDWLKRRFGRNRVVDLSCWKSEYRQHIASEKGNDRLGYDFEISNGGTRWFFEVKATTGDEPRSRQMIELGSSEIAHAEVCRADKRMRYRILYVLDALHPDEARIFVLPNPRSRAGQSFYADPLSAGVRLVFPLPTGS